METDRSGGGGEGRAAAQTAADLGTLSLIRGGGGTGATSGARPPASAATTTVAAAFAGDENSGGTVTGKDGAAGTGAFPYNP